MKKTVCFIIAVIMALTLVACGNNAVTGAKPDEGTTAATNGLPAETNAPKAEAEPTLPPVDEYTGDTTIKIKIVGPNTVVICESSLVEEFCKAAEGKEGSFGFDFLNDSGNLIFNTVVRYCLEAQGQEQVRNMRVNARFYESSEPTNVYETDEIRAKVEGKRAIWYLNGFDVKANEISEVIMSARVGSDALESCSETIPASQITVETVYTVGEPAYSILGEYVDNVRRRGTNEEKGEDSLYIEETADGYVAKYKEIVSVPLKSEVKGMGAGRPYILLEGALASGAPTTDGDWTIRVEFYGCDSKITDVNAKVSLINAKANADEKPTEMLFKKRAIRTGSYYCWTSDPGALSEENWDNAELVKVMDVECEDGKYRFTILDEYVSDWLEPTINDSHSITFKQESQDRATGKLERLSLYFFSTDEPFTRAGVMLGQYGYQYMNDIVRNVTTYSKVDEGVQIDYIGTYEQNDYRQPEQYTVVVEADKLTINDRYVVECTLEDMLHSWRQLTLTDTQTGAVYPCTVYLNTTDSISTMIDENTDFYYYTSSGTYFNTLSVRVKEEDGLNLDIRAERVDVD